jgi:hypothetical protein
MRFTIPTGRKAAQSICGAALAWAAMSAPALAAIEALTITTPHLGGISNPPFTLGWNFTVDEDITLVQLGLYDHNGDGLADAHGIGLWSSGGSLLRSVSIFDGVGDPSNGELTATNFRYRDVDPLLLTVGSTYYLGATYASSRDLYHFNGPGAFTSIDQISVIGGVQQNGGFAFPARPIANSTLIVGPNFRIAGDAVAPVPEPAAWALMIVGFGGAGLVLRRRRATVLA